MDVEQCVLFTPPPSLFLTYEAHRRHVTYKGHANHSLDAGSLRALHSIVDDPDMKMNMNMNMNMKMNMKMDMNMNMDMNMDTNMNINTNTNTNTNTIPNTNMNTNTNTNTIPNTNTNPVVYDDDQAVNTYKMESSYHSQHSKVVYFEVELLASNKTAIGFVTVHHQANEVVGDTQGSYAYRSNDGKKAHDGQWKSYGVAAGTGDVIGAGVSCGTREVFFTRNGKHMGVAFTIPENVKFNTLHVGISLHSEREQVMINMGETPFLWNVDAYRNEVRKKCQQERESIYVSPHTIHKMVVQYCLMQGFKETYEAMTLSERGEQNDNSTNTHSANNILMDEKVEEVCTQTLEKRSDIRKTIEETNGVTAIKMVNALAPQLLEERTDLHLQLSCLQFLKHVAEKQIEDAIEFAQRELVKYYCIPEYKEEIERVMACVVLPTTTPQNSLDTEEQALFPFLSIEHRQILADSVNRALIEHLTHLKSAVSADFSLSPTVNGSLSAQHPGVSVSLLEAFVRVASPTVFQSTC